MIVIDDTLKTQIHAQSLSTLILNHYPEMKLQMIDSVWKGLCPFHHEDTPSFIIHNNDGIESFYCYGCHAGNFKETEISSDMIGFIRAKDNLDFQEACARRYATSLRYRISLSIKTRR
jgi:DNA primase